MQCFKPSLGYIEFIKEKIEVVFIALINRKEEAFIDGVQYTFFRGRKGFFYIPLRMLLHVKKQKPDVLLIQGIGHPLQVILTRMLLKKHTVIIVQHHGEQPSKNKAALLQKIADKCIDAYFFTAAGNADTWIRNELISSATKCFEVLEASTYITKQDKLKSREILGIAGDTNILWVGRLEQNKDPLTVLNGFEKYLRINPAARLYMIYQEDILLQQVMGLIESSNLLKTSVILVGKVAHKNLGHWYSAADFYISGSHKEGSGYALIEAMACGCVPVVTDIPPYKAITNNGEHGVLYKKGNADALLQALLSTATIDKTVSSQKIAQYFAQQLSFQAIADNIFTICTQLVKKKQPSQR